MVEQEAVNFKVVSSSLARPAKISCVVRITVVHPVVARTSIDIGSSNLSLRTKKAGRLVRLDPGNSSGTTAFYLDL